MEDRQQTERATSRRRIRIAILLFVLFVVVLYAIRDVWSRRERNEWARTLDVAVVLVHVAGTDRADEADLAALRARTADLEARLEAEIHRYRPGAPRPFHFRVLGPVEADAAAPTPSGDGPAAIAKHSLELSRWVGALDDRAGVDSRIYDSRVYLSVARARAADPAAVEGLSEEGGRLAVVDVELDPAMIDLSLFVVTHELFHTLGATDKYDESGRARVPEGLAEPDLVPQYPQRKVEVMARNRPVAPGREVLPETLDELAVGALTAKEIGWVE